MRYVVERYKLEQREMAYRIYVTDSLRAIMGNEENRRFADILAEADTNTDRKEPEESAEEIIARIKGKVDLVNGNHGV